MSPRLPTTQRTVPPAVMLTPLAGSPLTTGEFSNWDSHPTDSLLSSQRVFPDLVST